VRGGGGESSRWSGAHPDAQDEAGLNPPQIASDYPSETGAELAEESEYEQVHPEMPFERAADYPAQTGEELAHRHSS
jgi:hypothetical protein